MEGTQLLVTVGGVAMVVVEFKLLVMLCIHMYIIMHQSNK